MTARMIPTAFLLAVLAAFVTSCGGGSEQESSGLAAEEYTVLGTYQTGETVPVGGLIWDDESTGHDLLSRRLAGSSNGRLSVGNQERYCLVCVSEEPCMWGGSFSGLALRQGVIERRLGRC